MVKARRELGACGRWREFSLDPELRSGHRDVLRYPLAADATGKSQLPVPRFAVEHRDEYALDDVRLLGLRDALDSFDRRDLVAHVSLSSRVWACATCLALEDCIMSDQTSTRNVLVRRAVDSDARAIAALLGELGYPATESETRGRVTALAARSDAAVFVACWGNAVAGVLSFHIIPLFHAEGNLGRITSLVVTKSARTHGVGRALVQAAEEFGNSHGCVRVEVTTGEHRPEAHLFYEKLGFGPVDRRFVKGSRLSGAGDRP